MLKKILYLLLPIVTIMFLIACGHRVTDITESDAYKNLFHDEEGNNILNLPEQVDALTNNSAPQDNDNARIMEFPYMPIEALIADTPGNNEFTGEYYFIHLFPIEYGEDIASSGNYFISGYAQHPDDESFSSMTIGGITSLEDWGDIFGNTHGFLIAFRFVGYTETYNMAYGIYVSHEIAPEYFDMYS